MANTFNRKLVSHNPMTANPTLEPNLNPMTAHGIKHPIEEDKQLYQSLYAKYVHARNEISIGDRKSAYNLKLGIVLALHKKGRLTTAAIQRTLRVGYDNALKLKKDALVKLCTEK